MSFVSSPAAPLLNELLIVENQSLFRALFDGSSDMYILMSIEEDGSALIIRECNDTVASLNGYTREELVGQNITVLEQREGGIHGESSDKKNVEMLREKKSLRFEVPGRRRDGSLFPLDVTLTLIQFEGREAVLGVGRDVSATRAVEQALRESQNRWEACMAGSTDGIWDWQMDTNKVFYSPRWKQMLGYTDAEFPNEFNESQSRIHPDDLPRVLSAVNAHLTGQTSHYRVEMRMRHKDGSYRWILSRAVVIKDAEGRPVRMSGSHSDVTDRKRSENALEKAQEELAEYAARLERQAQQLAVARDSALAATRAKSEFLANMSHEIRTPMNGVLGMTGLLLDTSLTEEQREYAQIIRNSADSLLTVINDILDFSKIESGKMQIEVMDFNLRTVMEEVADLFAHRVYEKGLELTCHIPPSFPENLRGDHGRIRQILTNLVGNAIKFTEKGQITLETMVLDETPTSAKFRVGVQDTGIGIPPERQKAIFDSFMQADGSTTRRYGGTGLGLTICRQLVELMGGRISVESEPGRGSTFWLELTLEKHQNAVEVPAFSLAPEQLRGAYVLIVDDNPTNRHILREQLRSWGCRTEEAGNGIVALRALNDAYTHKDPFTLVLLDMQMPEIDGEQTAILIRNDRRFEKLPMLLLSSAFHNGDDKSRVLQAGFSAVLSKPIRQVNLLNAVLAALGTQGEMSKVEAGAATEQVPLKLRVLLAEDNSVNQKVALKMLQKWECRADAVGNGAEAVEALKTLHYDVVLMDVQMPEMDGFEATRCIRDWEGRRELHTPIIAMTAHSMAGDKERCLDAGMDDYVAKPVRAEELYRTLRRWQERLAERNGRGEDKPMLSLISGGEGFDESIPVLDEAQLRDACGDDEETIREVLADYLRVVPEGILRLQSAIDAGDVGAVHREAHSLKGSSRTVGAEAFAAVCEEMEQAARDGSVAVAVAKRERLQSEWERLYPLLTDGLLEEAA